MDYSNILWAFVWFAILGGVLGTLLAIASRIFAVKTDPRIDQITALLPGANCGGCGFTGCAALAEAIVSGTAPCNGCAACGDDTIAKIAEISGQNPQKSRRMRAQVMCSGFGDSAKRKYIYSGAKDCYSAVRLGGGSRECPNGCVGFGSCVEKCPFGAISLKDGVAVVDYHKCRGCGVCADKCPKHIIKLIPYDSKYWVGCMSVDKGPMTKSYCDVGCISCRLCEKACEAGAVKVNDFVASINYELCTGCGKCAERCPRGIITGTTPRINI